MVGIRIRNTGRTDNLVENIRQSEKFEPTLGQQITTGFKAGFDAPGSFSEDFDAATVNEELGRELTIFQSAASSIASPFADEPSEGQPLSKEDYQNSTFFREELPYEDGLTTTAAQIRARRHDAERERSFIMEQSSIPGKAVFFASSLSGAIGDIKNLTAGVGAAFATGGIATAVPAIRAAAASTNLVGRGAAVAGRTAPIAARAAPAAGQAASTAQSVGRVAAEATLATLPAVISGVQNQPTLASQYELSDAFVDMSASVLLSVGISAVTGRAVTFYNNRSGLGEKRAVTELMAHQLAAAEKIDLRPLTDAQMAREVEPFTTVNPRQDKPTVIPPTRGDDQFTASFSRDEGVMSGVVAKGASPDEAVANLRSLYLNRVAEAAEQVGLAPERLRQIARAQQSMDRAQTFNIRERELEIAREQGLDVEPIIQAQEQVRIAEENLATAQSALDSRPASAGRQQAFDTANRKAQTARETLQNRRAEILGEDIPARARQDQVEARNVAQREFDAVRDLQTREAGEAFRDFARRQTDNSVAGIKSRSSDSMADDIDLDRVATEAEGAPRPGEQTVTPGQSGKRLQDLLEQEGTPDETKRFIREVLDEEVNARQNRAASLRSLKSCKGGR